jgi:hypothetical protein
MKIRNWIKAYRQAVELFGRTRCYENNIAVRSVREYDLRWVVRYHVMLHADGYDRIDRFGRPRSRRELVALCNEAMAETTRLWRELCYINSTRQYYSMRVYLKRLRFSAEHFPILFHLEFLPLLRFLRKPVAPQ